MEGIDAFMEMARAFPGRTILFTVALPVFALVQLVNGYVHDGSLPHIGGLACLTVAFSIQATRYHLAEYRRSILTTRWVHTDSE